MDNIVIRIKIDSKIKDKQEFRNSFNACFNSYLDRNRYNQLIGIINEEVKCIRPKGKEYCIIEMRTNHFRTKKLSSEELGIIIKGIRKIAEPCKVQFIEKCTTAKGNIVYRNIKGA